MAKAVIETDWMSVIGKCLAYLCLEQARQQEPKKFDTIPKKVEFLKSVGLPKDAAAFAAGSSPESVAALERQQRAKKGAARGKKTKK